MKVFETLSLSHKRMAAERTDGAPHPLNQNPVTAGESGEGHGETGPR